MANDFFVASSQGVQVQQSRVDRMMTNIRVGTAFALSDLINALQDQVKNDLDLTSAQYSFMMSKASLNRLEMSGPYQDNLL